MTNLFKKAAIATDLHLGLKSNSVTHNEDCWEFIQWFVETAKRENCETCLFLGDYHNNRSTINNLTLSYSLKCLEHLNNNFERVYFIPGNHDLYFRDRRDVQSVAWAKYLSNVVICNDWFQEGNVVIAPWLVKDDHKRLSKLKAKYLFGHFELPGYFMNAMVQMPDHGEFDADALSGFEHVYSGHFHKRQSKSNVTYIGNCFPHNYADAWDDARGMAVLEWDKPTEYHAWPNAPKYRTLKLSQLIDGADSILKSKMYLRVDLDIDISFEEASYIKETFMNDYDIRELTLIPEKRSLDAMSAVDVQAFESVDQIVASQLVNIESDAYDRNILLSIYNSL